MVTFGVMGSASVLPITGVREWTLVIPVKPAAIAKSRLLIDGIDKPTLARAIALDTIEAASRCDRVAQIVVVTADSVITEQLQTFNSVRVVADDARGLMAAIELGLTHTERSTARAVMLGDLPALRPEQLSIALARATTIERAFVPDADGTGTSLATARAGVPLQTKFGPSSAAAHSTAGFTEVRLPAASGLRRDLDTIEHLELARGYGFGPRTAALIG